MIIMGLYYISRLIIDDDRMYRIVECSPPPCRRCCCWTHGGRARGTRGMAVVQWRDTVCCTHLFTSGKTPGFLGSRKGSARMASSKPPRPSSAGVVKLASTFLVSTFIRPTVSLLTTCFRTPFQDHRETDHRQHMLLQNRRL